VVSISHKVPARSPARSVVVVALLVQAQMLLLGRFLLGLRTLEHHRIHSGGQQHLEVGHVRPGYDYLASGPPSAHRRPTVGPPSAHRRPRPQCYVSRRFWLCRWGFGADEIPPKRASEATSEATPSLPSHRRRPATPTVHPTPPSSSFALLNHSRPDQIQHALLDPSL